MHKHGETSPEKRLKIALLERDMTPADLANALGLSLSYVYSLCSGHVRTERARNRIEEYLGERIWTTGELISTGGVPENQKQVTP